jgi:hypothetical protein
MDSHAAGWIPHAPNDILGSKRRWHLKKACAVRLNGTGKTGRNENPRYAGIGSDFHIYVG